MRATTLAIASLVLVSAAACERRGAAPEAEAPGEAARQAPEGLAADGAPKRRPGLWEQRVSTEGTEQVTRICLDAATEERMSLWGAQATRDMCEENRITRQGDGWRFSSVCDMGTGGMVASQGVVEGDLDRAYTVEAQTTTTGAAAPQMNATRTMTVRATWQGPCPEGFRPGDVELPGGMRVNLMDMSAGAGK